MRSYKGFWWGRSKEPVPWDSSGEVVGVRAVAPVGGCVVYALLCSVRCLASPLHKLRLYCERV